VSTTELADQVMASSPAGEDEDPRRHEIRVSGRNPADIARDVMAELVRQNDPPALFRMGSAGDAVVRAGAAGDLIEYTSDRWLFHVSDSINFVSVSKDGGRRIVGPPRDAMRIIPPAALEVLPVLDGIATTPYLTASGAIVSEDGYNAESRLLLRTGGLRMPEIPAGPSRTEVAQAVDLLLTDWLGDFPFATTADRANALALLLTLTGRAFTGKSPLTVIDASTAGSGKNLLVTTAHLIATGATPELRELPADGEEQRKKVTSVLMTGADIIVWDESHVITGRTLAMILTSDVYSDRLLGGNKMVAIQNRFTQVALGNNVQVFGDMKRRVVPVRLVPDCERPELRSGFRHQNLEQWVRDNRGALLAAALTLWRAWIAAGKPRANVTMGSFERWAGVIGGVLETAGIDGFMSTTTEWAEASDSETGIYGGHLSELRARYGGDWFTARDVATAVESGYLTRPPIRRDPRGQERPLAESIGYLYRSIRDQWHEGCKLAASETAPKGIRRWRVAVREDSEIPAVNLGNDAIPSPPITTPAPEMPGSPASGVGMGWGGMGSNPGFTAEKSGACVHRYKGGSNECINCHAVALAGAR